MKAIRFILAIYLLALTVYPCSDENTCADERKTGVSFVDTGNHSHSSEEQDACTPFCICSCCAAHIRLSIPSEPHFEDFTHTTKQVTFYFQRPMLNNGQSIWQPPKIS